MIGLNTKINILVSGGASGLGEAITRKLAADTENVVHFTYNNSAENAAGISREFGNARAYHCNFKDSQSIAGLLDKLDEMDLDVLVNNAMAGFTKKHFHKFSPEEFAESFRINVLPTIRITRKALEIFRKKKFGKIITVLTAALVNKPPVGWSEYVANKAYLLAMSKSWSTENAAFNISANCVSPSLMLTNLHKDLDERIVENYQQNHPLKKMLTTEEVAESVAYLARATQQINGINLIINSGSDVI